MKIPLPFLACLYGLAQSAVYPLLRTIPLPGVEGRIDHMAADTAGHRLFIAALGNNSVEVADLRQGKAIRSIRGMDEPQGVAYVPKGNRIVVACGGDGSVKVLDGTSYLPIKTLDLRSDADNVRYVPAENRIYVGYGSGGIAIIDPDSGIVLSTIKLEGHPESFQLETEGRRIFANVPGENEIEVLDRGKMSAISHWSPVHMRSNFPMALDEPDHRLFIGVRWPPALRVFDTESGKSLAEIPIGGDVDDVFFDPKSRRLFLSCGGGSLNVIRQVDPDHYERIDQIPTAMGARTGIFLPEEGMFYLAVPAQGSRQAEIRVYSMAP